MMLSSLHELEDQQFIRHFQIYDLERPSKLPRTAQHLQHIYVFREQE